MPKPRLIEVPQKQSPRIVPPIRPSEPLPNRIRTERSPRLAEVRGTRSEPVNKKKLGSRIADLESQLGQAQDELRSLKDQLVSAETAKKVAQEQLEKKAKKIENSSENVELETDVFEVPIETKSELKSKPDDELDSKKNAVNEKEIELESIRGENSSLKSKLNGINVELSAAHSEIELMKSRIDEANRELESSKSSILEVNEKLEAAEKAKAELEIEMKRVRIQTEQWRKAADAAAAVLAGGVEPIGRRIPERCGSMDKHYGSSIELGSGFADSPGLIDEDQDDVFESSKRKGSSIRKIGDLWKKKSHK